MKTLILMMSFFILSSLFSSCSKTIDGVALDTKKTIADALDIKAVKQKCTYPKIRIYPSPREEKCPKSMTLKECFMMQYRIARHVRSTLVKQRNTCIAINKRYKK